MDSVQDSKLTINKVAELCGVSKTTISRYLNGKYDNMSPETRERIAAVITGLDYRPNRTAQRLKSQRSMLIGCVIADAGSPFSALLLKGISACCEKAGYQVLFADSGENPEREKQLIQGFLESHVDGLLVNTTGGNNELLKDLSSKMSIVLVDRLIKGENFDSVTSPNYETSQKITNLMLSMGYEDITVITEPIRNITPRVERYEGYCAAMAAAGLTPSIYEVNQNDVSGCTAFLKQFQESRPGKRLAMLCTNGVAALAALLATYAANITLGYGFGCCTFDDWNWLQLAKPKISSIQLGTEEKGYRAAELLLQRITKSDKISEEPQHILVASTPVIRASTVSWK